jgi:hypothetical protein
MSKKGKIEDIFRDEFKDFSLEPSDKVWDGIENQISGMRLEHLYQVKFRGFKMSVADHVWRRIATALWFNKFLHFSPFSFNIYYAGLIITTIVGSIIFFNNTEFKFFNFDGGREILINDNSQIQNNDIPALNNLTEDTQITISSDNKENDNSVSINKITLIGENSKTSPIHITTIVFTKNTNNEISEIVENQINNNLFITKYNANTQTGEIQTYSKIPHFLNLNKPLYLRYPELKISNDSLLNNFIVNYEIKRDTIGYDFGGVPIVEDKSFVRFSIFYDYYINNKYRFKLNNPELQNEFKTLSENLKDNNSFGFGLGIDYFYRRFYINSGISYFTNRQKINFEKVETEINTITEFQYFDNSVWIYDTVWFLDLDEYLNGNIVYIPHVDSTNFVFKDSISIAIKDTVLKNLNYSAENSMSYIEIPVVFGYSFKTGKLEIIPKAGIIGGLLTGKKGNFYDLYSDEILPIAEIPYREFNLDYYFSLNLNYSFTKKFGIYVEPYFRDNFINSFNGNYALDLRSMRYGLRTGISYKL